MADLAAQVLAADEKATPAPWKVWGMQVFADPVGDSNLDTALLVAHTNDPHRGLRTFNADLIALYRSAAPVLARENQALREQVAQVRALADWWASASGPSAYDIAARDHASQLRAALGER
jgi:hypothetical protein